MSAALPPDLFNPLYTEIEEEADTEDVNFATDSDFLFKCWQSYDVRSQYEDKFATPRCRNLFWRVWSNPKLRSISNQEFNQLWRRCGRDTPLRPYLPNPAVWPRCPQLESLSHPQLDVPVTDTCRGPPSPTSPRVTKISFEQDSLEPPSRSGRERGSSGASSGATTRPAVKRTPSGRATGAAGTSRGGRSRPGLIRRKSSQTRSGARASDPIIARAAAPEDSSQPDADRPSGKTVTSGPNSSAARRSAQSKATFEIASSWQSDEDSGDEKKTQPTVGPTGSLVQPDFRSKFAEQRHLSSGTSLPTMDAIRKVRSSVRFADDHDIVDKSKGKGRPELEGNGSVESRPRSDSQVLADSDDSEERAELPRVQSSLSMMIQDRRKQSGSRDIGPSSQPEGAKSNEARRKRDELLQMGREAAKPNIPTARSRRASREADDARYRSPSPTATF